MLISNFQQQSIVETEVQIQLSGITREISMNSRDSRRKNVIAVPVDVLITFQVLQQETLLLTGSSRKTTKCSQTHTVQHLPRFQASSPQNTVQAQDFLWGTPDQVGQECSGQQVGWAYQQSFKLDLGGTDVLLSDGREHGNIVTLGNNRLIKLSQINQEGFL